MVAQAICHLLSQVSAAVDMVTSGEALVASVRDSPPDVVIADVSIPGVNGIDAMKILHDEGHKTPLVFLSVHDEPSMAAMALRAGAMGYLPKSAAGEELLRALGDVVEGRTYVASTLTARMAADPAPVQPRLTPSHLRVLELVAQGKRPKEIAGEMGLSVRTIESHKYMMMQELGVRTTLALLRRAKEKGYISA
ncbi:hypothetical protein BIY45_01090 [Stenotrophomonas sp. BIIR7]|nr:hypothetical protein BIY45_01090 [Stenotrophomonas sp. BIIR7]